MTLTCSITKGADDPKNPSLVTVVFTFHDSETNEDIVRQLAGISSAQVNDDWLNKMTAALAAEIRDQRTATAFIGSRSEPISIPETPKSVSRIAFFRLFTKAERIALRQAATINDDVADLHELFVIADQIDLNDPDVVAGVSALEAGKLLASGRANEILSGQRPA